jgi:hypothetical protein
LGLDRSTVWRMRQRGEGPPRIQLSERRFGYSVLSVLQWLGSRGAGCELVTPILKSVMVIEPGETAAAHDPGEASA